MMMRNRATIALAILLGLWPFPTARNAWAGGDPVLRAMRVGPQAGGTRFVAELSDRVDLSVVLLTDSDGIALNFRKLRFAPALACNGQAGLVRTVQCSVASDGRFQIVLRTNGSVAVSKMAVLEPRAGGKSYRLLVDLAPAGSAQSSPSDPARRYPTRAFSARQTQAPGNPQQAGAPGGSSFVAAVRAAAARQPRIAATSPGPLQQPAIRQASPEPNGGMDPLASTSQFPVPNSGSWAGGSRSAGLSRPGLMFPYPSNSESVTRVAIMPPAHPTMRPAPQAVPGPMRIPVVVIDPGHGGIDPGATGLGGEQEKDITLAQALALRRELEATGRFRVLMTRNSDRFIPLPERVNIARKAGADMFVSIHADSISRSEMRGAGIYTLSDQASDAEAATLASKENRADIVAGVDLGAQSPEVSSILIDFAQHETRDRSVRLASLLMPEIGQVVPLRRNSHRSAGFRVLKAPDVASVLVELGYLSNPQDKRMLTSPASRAALAVALSRGIQAYFNREG